MSTGSVAVVGTTASGKSDAALAAARRLDDIEIVCVDSMTVYRGMDIATAKPSSDARAAVPHHLLDLVEPHEEFTVREFQRAALCALADIERRGRRPLLVGGTGLYLRAVIDRLQIPPRYPAISARLDAEADAHGPERLHDRLAALDPVAAARTTRTNRRRIVRALEVTLGSGRPFSSFGPGLTAYPPTDTVLIGLAFEPEDVDRRIEERVAGWVAAGFVEEVRALSRRPEGLSRTARQALGYREVLHHIEDGVALEECLAETVRRTRALARRQWSWFRRDPRITWVQPADAVDALCRALSPGDGSSGDGPSGDGPSGDGPSGDGRSGDVLLGGSEGRPLGPAGGQRADADSRASNRRTAHASAPAGARL